MKFSLLLVSLFSLTVNSGCKSRDVLSSQLMNTDTPSKLIELPEWEKLVGTKAAADELGCVCEIIENSWHMYRYANLAQTTYKIHIGDYADLKACVESKFQGNNCQFKF